MNKFIYVFSGKDAETLLKRGYCAVRSDISNSVYVFENKEPENLEFSLEFPFVLSNVLSF